MVYELDSKCSLHRKIEDAVDQLFMQIPRRHRRLPIRDDEFFQVNKSQKLEQSRKYFRDGTRLYDPTPAHTNDGYASNLLCPTSLSTDPRYVMTLEKPTVLTETKTLTAAKIFPGSVPVSLMQEDIPKLYDGAYYFVWAPKTNGLRFFAIACTFGHCQWVVLVNRAQQKFVVPNVSLPSAVYDGTLLDGELVPTRDGSYAFIAYDCAMTCGNPCAEYNYLVRLQLASLVLTLFPAGSLFEWRVKKVYGPDKFSDLLQTELPSLDHDIDGFMATAVEPPIQIGQTQTILKVKRSTDHTIDFLFVQTSSSVYDLVVMETKGQMISGVLWDTIHLSSPWVDQKLNGKIVECRYHPEKESWEPEHVRLDKTVPNKLSTALKTWKNVQENLGLLDLFPVGALPEATRTLLKAWENDHPRWKPKSNVDVMQDERTLPGHHMAPVELKKLILV